jgi:SAM-dependent methyltransferase
MKLKIAVGVLMAFIILAGAVWYFGIRPSSPEDNAITDSKPAAVAAQKEVEKKALTIRNVTDKTIHYTMKPLGADAQPEMKSIEVGAVHRFPGNSAMKIFFRRSGETISYHLDPGMPYSFRYDENDELELYDGSHGRVDQVDLAPYVPTPRPVVEKMLEMADLDRNDIVYDLGCGDGRIVIMAAKRYGARGIGIDLDPQRISESQLAAAEAGVEDLVEFRMEDATKSDFSDATIVTLYLLTESNELLRPELERQLKPGAYVVSHNYPIPGWEKKEIEFVTVVDDIGEEHYIYLYQR